MRFILYVKNINVKIIFMTTLQDFSDTGKKPETLDLEGMGIICDT